MATHIHKNNTVVALRRTVHDIGSGEIVKQITVPLIGGINRGQSEQKSPHPGGVWSAASKITQV